MKCRPRASLFFAGDRNADTVLSLADANEIKVLLGSGDGIFTGLTLISAPGQENDYRNRNLRHPD